MIKYDIVKEEIEKKVPKSKVCDKCKKEYTKEDGDIWEYQEFCHIRFTGGYGSIFGDEEEIKIDLCQHCLYKMIGDLIK